MSVKFISLLLVSLVLSAAVYSQTPVKNTTSKKVPKVVVWCDSTAKSCILVVTKDVHLLLDDKDDILWQLGLLPEELIAIKIESNVEKNMNELWREIPKLYRGKLKGVMKIEHRGKIKRNVITPDAKQRNSGAK